MNAETILIVDDNHEICNVLAHKILPALGHKAVYAHTGSRGLEAVRKNNFSLILLDLQLPDMTGLDFLRQLTQEGRDVPTIIITSEGSENIAAEAFRLGVQDYLIKPGELEIENLDRAITRALKQSRMRREKEELSRQLQEQVSWLTVLLRISQSVTSTLDLEEVLRRIVEASVFLTQADEGFLALKDEKTGRLYLRTAKNIDQEKVEEMRLPVNDSLVGMVMSTRKPYRSSRTPESPLLKVSTGYLVHSLIHVPLISKGKVLGVLSVDIKNVFREFTDMHETVLVSLAHFATIALDNASLYLKARQELAERKRIEQALRKSEERYVLAVQGANDGIWDWDLKTGDVYYSSRWKSMLGYEDHEINSQWEEWISRIHPDDVERVKLELSSHLHGQTAQFENEYRMLHRDGNYRYMLCRAIAIRDTNDLPYRMAGSQTDITNRKDAEAKLLFNAFNDPLTNLPNRALFMDRLHYSVERAKRRDDYKFAVLFLDLDRFKDINDSMGHLMGDQMLVEVSAILKSGLRASDTVARLGGDEFVILLEDINAVEDAVSVADWIHREVSHTLFLKDKTAFITISIGIVWCTAVYERAEDVLRDADIAMYSAKSNGRDRYEVFTTAMRDRILERLALEAELRQALTHDEFVVHYQPLVALDHGTLLGFEALVRWQHPEKGLLLPEAFLPIAEETGMIVHLDRWVLYQACSAMYEWKAKYPKAKDLTISVNFSGKQLKQANLIETISKILKETGLDPKSLVIELTETTVVEENEATIKLLKKMKNMGIQVEIDDFGVGYSSLNYLSNFPVSALKIDKSFISTMVEDNNQRQIVQTIIQLTRQLGLRAIAEGVETDSQLEQLRELGCGIGQGYLLSVPLDREAARQLLQSERIDTNMLMRLSSQISQSPV